MKYALKGNITLIIFVKKIKDNLDKVQEGTESLKSEQIEEVHVVKVKNKA